ncbi:MAG TPA: glutamate--tRNA ligase [Fimbriimonadaceae bacterium]|nr:glutamate--tRNA ligase [Fimbriimonadaceae bacterium]
MSVRVRFAPSPTGMLHVGALRDCLFKQLFARHNGGDLILRIEDTDRTRYNPESEQEFIDTLHWVGIDFDEGPHIGGPHAPYRQSERKEAGIYAKWIQVLLEGGHAYKAFETREELDEMREIQKINKQPTGYYGGAWRDAPPDQVAAAEAAGKPYVIRQRIRRGRTIVIEDTIRGRIEWESDTVDDQVLIKEDGMPTYHFAAMVDDHLMGITHIMRGEEWISSAPKHAELFDLFGWSRPIFVHCPVIVGPDGKKLSKRHGATRVLDYAACGYLPESLKNFIALIGWSPGDDREVMTEQELIDAFDLKGLQPSPGRFDLEKLKWLNGHAIRAMDPNELLDTAIAFATSPHSEQYWGNFEPDPENPEDAKVDAAKVMRGMDDLVSASRADRNYALAAVKLEQERVVRLCDLGEACRFFFVDEVEFDSKAVEKWFGQPHVEELFNFILAKLADSRVETVEHYHDILQEFQTHKGFEKLGPVVHPTRVALTGRTFGPGLYELMSVLGHDRIAARLNRALTMLR